MTPTEVTNILRQFNAWRRDLDDKFEQPDAREISEAIDAAIELIDRLEAAERNLSCCRAEREEAASLFLSAKTRLTKERDALQAKIEQMERQEPVAWMPIEKSQDGRNAVRKFFRETLNRWDFDNYINQRLAADFACVLGGYLYAVSDTHGAKGEDT